MQTSEGLSSLSKGEEPHSFIVGLLSFLLYPPISAFLFGTLLFLALIRIPIIEAKASPHEAAPTDPQVASFFSPQVRRWESQILSWASAHNLDPNLVATIMQIESCGDPQALSPAGAIGLFQVMPYHFEDGEDPYAPATNARRGLGYLQLSLASFEGDSAMAMAAYNGGINGVSRPQSQWPQETISYMYWGANIYADAISGNTSSPVLDEWLNAGGASLCAQAERQLAQLP